MVIKLGFQSLIGFKINWNNGNETAIINSLKFQSLIGFKINWNCSGSLLAIPGIKVSIPNRV